MGRSYGTMRLLRSTLLCADYKVSGVKEVRRNRIRQVLCCDWADTLEIAQRGRHVNAANILADESRFPNHVLANVKHFFAKILLLMAIAVLTDNLGSNHNVWDFVDYFKHGEGNGAINNGISNIVQTTWYGQGNYFKQGQGNLAENQGIAMNFQVLGTGKAIGQGQASGRNQGHSARTFQVLGAIQQQAFY
ncbi:hypothetical protein CEK25_002257 [Fusarium fujikuroi]|nr:hypothetical protein CEK25_002257 [Fusarium fujikuroi]